MAKRRRLEAPSSSDLARIEQEFRSETSRSVRGAAPIAQVAADTAGAAEPGDPETRAARARDQADARRLQEAQASGLLMTEIPLAEIDEAAMIRDRMVMTEEDMTELRLSISVNGLRLPIEVFELEAPQPGGARYGLLSGYRRLQAVRTLQEESRQPRFDTIRSLIRPRAEVDASFVAMVEENEIRAELSHFERGRIAVIAADQGAFANTEEAVSKLFASASKAKRSKIRSFALIFEELGDMLAFPESLSERRGLQLASALRDGAEADLRQALERDVANPEEEWAVIEATLATRSQPVVNAARGGRPKQRSGVSWVAGTAMRTRNGVMIRRGHDGDAHLIRLEGAPLDDDLIEALIMQLSEVLDG